MIKAAITGKRQVEFIEMPMPKTTGDWVLVKVHASALCTEYKSYLEGQEMMSMGHEGVGEVMDIAQPGSVEVGDRVVILPGLPCGKCLYCMYGDQVYCQDKLDFEALTGSTTGRGTFGQYILKPSWLLPKIPDDVSYAKATMAIDGIGASFGGFQSINVNAQDTILITGLGPVGQGALVNARYRNARVIGVEPAPWRAERGREMGAEAVLDPQDPDILDQIMDLTDGRGVDCAADCSGRVSSQRLCIDAVRKKGRIAFIGECFDELTITVSPDMNRKGLTMTGNTLYNRGDFPKVMKVIRESPLIDLLVSHEMPMSQIQECFEMLARGESGKIVVDPWK